MPIPVIMPKLEMSQETALIVEWLKKEGDQVEQGEALLKVETDKITMEVESPSKGVLAGILVKENDVVPVATAIAYLLREGETGADIPKQFPGTIQNQVEKNNNIPQPSSLNVTPIAARMAIAKGLDLKNIIGTGRNGGITRADVEGAIQAQNVLPGKQRATPAARKASIDSKLNLEEIRGSGPRGRIQLIDVQSYQQQLNDDSNQDEVIQLKGIRRTIAQRMQSSYQTVPHVYLTCSVDMTSIEALKLLLNKRKVSSETPHITLTALITKYTARALKRHLILNSNLEKDVIRIKKDINIGIAVALENGLIVPVIKNADQKSLDEISIEVNQLTEKARSSMLEPMDVAGGTFTISNLGPFGVEEFTAIINPGQTSILAVGAVIPTPIASNQQLVIRPQMKLTLAVDHRVIDGAMAAHFLMELKSIFENPAIIES